MLNLFGKRRPSPDVDPTSLCNLLVTLGWITTTQLQDALMKKQDELIGQTLISMNLISQEQLDEALARQKLQRKEVTPKDAVVAALDRQSENQNKIIEGFKELREQIVDASSSAKFEPVKRGGR